MTAPTSATAGPSAGRGPQAHLLSNSTVAFVLAALVAVPLHELSHAVAGLLRGLHPTLHSYSVSYTPPGDTASQIVTAATGPLFSLVLGAAVLLLGRHAGRGFLRLFLMWLGLLALQGFAGYLLIAPISRAGDTGKVLALLGVPLPVYVLSALLGVAGTLWLSRCMAAEAQRYARGKPDLFKLVMYPWLIGTGILVALSPVNLSRTDSVSGAEYVLIMAAATATGIFAPMFTFFWKRVEPGPVETLDLRRPVVPLVVTVVLAVLGFLFVAPGVPLG